MKFFTYNHQLSATLIGQAGLFMWAISPSFVASLYKIPSYEILAIIFFVGFLCCALYNTLKRNWQSVFNHPPYIWIAGIFGICGNEVLFIMSFKKAPVAHVDLIIYLWPIMVILFSSLLPKEKLSFKHIVASFIAFFAIYLLLSHERSIVFNVSYIEGYLCAFGAAVFWTIYTLCSKLYNKLKSEMIAIYCGFGFLFSTIMHIYYEETVIPAISEIIMLLCMGVATHSLAYFCWDFGVKKGNFKLLSVLSYFNPIISVFILIYLGFAEMSVVLLTSASLICIAGLIGGIKYMPSELEEERRKC